MQVFKGKTLGCRQHSRKHNKRLLRLSKGMQEMGWLACLHGAGRKSIGTRLKHRSWQDFCTVCTADWEGRTGPGYQQLSLSPSVAGVGEWEGCCWAGACLALQFSTAGCLQDFKYLLTNSLQLQKHFCLHLILLEYILQCRQQFL